MANVLGALFGEIADAIREKTGETGTMKPAQFPEKIGAIEVGGGSSADVRYVTFMNGGVELYRKPVAVGDDCVDVLSKGLISKPTKESTVSTVYTYSGWALTDGGEADSSALSAVEKDRTVYAAFTASARKYTVNFYDGETLLQSMQVAYGSTPTIAMPEKDGYSFTEWQPAITSVTTDANYYAQWEEKLTFAGGSWADIAAVAEAGEAEQYFAIGDERVEGDFILQIAAFNHDKKTDGTTAGITIIAKASDIRMQANQYGANGGGYGTGGGLGSTVNSTVLAKLSEQLQSVIKSVIKSYNKPSTTSVSTIVSGSYKVWIPSCKEVTGVDLNNLSYPETQYPLFTDTENIALYTSKTLNSKTYTWWFRETENRQANANTYWYCSTNTSPFYTRQLSNNESSVRFGFCI